MKPSRVAIINGRRLNFKLCTATYTQLSNSDVVKQEKSCDLTVTFQKEKGMNEETSYDENYLDDLASDIEVMTPVPDGTYDMVAGKTAPEF
jgi:hypothetical protein